MVENSILVFSILLGFFGKFVAHDKVINILLINPGSNDVQMGASEIFSLCRLRILSIFPGRYSFVSVGRQPLLLICYSLRHSAVPALWNLF